LNEGLFSVNEGLLSVNEEAFFGRKGDFNCLLPGFLLRIAIQKEGTN
jgi:hypothetical protein